MICNLLNKLIKSKPKNIDDFKTLINFTIDRAGHDKKYFLKSGKIEKYLNWRPKYDIKKGLKITLLWYLRNMKWYNNKL